MDISKYDSVRRQSTVDYTKVSEDSKNQQSGSNALGVPESYEN